MSSAFNLRYWHDAYDSNNMNYPYISIPNDNFLSDESDSIIRHQKCEFHLIKPQNSNNTILKIFEKSKDKAKNKPFIYLKNSYFGEKENSFEIPDDLITYNAYTYAEFAELGKKLSIAIKMNKLYTESVHKENKISLIAMETSQTLESLLVFISSYYNDYTNVLINENSSPEEVFTILKDTEVESLFCSKKLIFKLIEYLKKNTQNKSFICLKNVVFYEDSDQVEEIVLEFLNQNNIIIKELLLWDLVYCLESISSKQKLDKDFTYAKSTTPAVISYKFESNFTNYKAIVLNHHNIIGKVLGYCLFFQYTFSRDSSDIFAICNNISNLDCLCIFLLGVYLSNSVILLESSNHLFIKEIKNSICPQFVYIDHLQFSQLYKRIDEYCLIKLGVRIENIEHVDLIKKYENISNHFFGDKLKIMMLYNQNNISQYQIAKFKFISPFLIPIAQGYREETIGSILVSIVNNLISGSFGLPLPCYECKLNKLEDEKEFELDNLINTYTGNLLLRGEALFDSYFKYYKEDIFSLTFDDKNWLKTNLKSVLTKNCSIKILDKVECIKNTVKVKSFHCDFIKSLLIGKDMISLVEKVDILVDELNYELVIKFTVRKSKWEDFITIFLHFDLNLKSELGIGLDYVNKNNPYESKFDIKEFIKRNEHVNCITIFDKYGYELQINIEQMNYSDKSNISNLKSSILRFYEQLLGKNFLLDFDNVHKIILSSE